MNITIWKTLPKGAHRPFSAIFLLILVSLSPSRVTCNKVAEEQDEQQVAAESKVIRDREPLYESAINLQAVEVDPKEVDHLISASDGHGGRSVRAYPRFIPQENDGRVNDDRQKSYAFAYAVRDGDRGDDFSHKERREGKVTIGEYSVVLPDGRTQVVRYTADGKDGFKADVTYEGEAKPNAYSRGPNPTPAGNVVYQPAGSAVSAHAQVQAPYISDGQEPYRKSFKPIPVTPLPRILASPSPSTRGPVYLSYPLKARRPSLPPSVVYDPEEGPVAPTPASIIYGRPGSLPEPPPSAYPIPSKRPSLYLASGSSKLLRSSNLVSPTPGSFKYYPSPTPNTLQYDRAEKYRTTILRNTNQFSHRSQPVESPPPTDLASPYGKITRGQRAGPDSSRVSTLPTQPPALKFLHRGPSPTPYYVQARQQQQQTIQPQYVKAHEESYDTSKSSLVPIQYFKAGPSAQPVLIQEQSIKQVYTPAGLSTPAPVYPSPTPVAYIDNGITPDYNSGVPESDEGPVYVPQAPQQPLRVAVTPVKSSVATYTTGYLGVTPKPQLFQSTSNPGVAVGRPVKPSRGGLVYLEGPRPTPRQIGIKKVLSRLPNYKPSRAPLKTYEVGRPDFGSSVSYSSTDDEEGEYERGRVGKPNHANQLSPLHGGVLREYLVEKRIGAAPYEEELV